MNEYMKVAKDLACENLRTNNGGPFGACVVKNGKIIFAFGTCMCIIRISLIHTGGTANESLFPPTD